MVDCGYSTWSGATLYYREFGTGWMYETTLAPGTTTWYGEVVHSGEDILSANVETYWSAASIGDRVDYWISADNGTHWEEVESETTIHFDHPGKELVWKAQLIGSTAVSWWVDIEYAHRLPDERRLDITALQHRYQGGQGSTAVDGRCTKSNHTRRHGFQRQRDHMVTRHQQPGNELLNRGGRQHPSILHPVSEHR